MDHDVHLLSITLHVQYKIKKDENMITTTASKISNMKNSMADISSCDLALGTNFNIFAQFKIFSLIYVWFVINSVIEDIRFSFVVISHFNAKP